MKNFILLGVFLLSFVVYSGKTPKDTSKVEFIQAYFNGKSNHSYALPGNESRDQWDMIQVIVDLIDSAKYSVDLVAYDLQNMRVGSALAAAKRRGCRVRVITDIIHREHAPRFNIPMWDTLRSADIISFDDAGTIYWPDGRIEALPKKLPNSGANLHHKFAVIDKVSDNPDDYYVWTGTMNLTYTGNWNTNATLLIKDSGIADAYYEEFEQMWGSQTAIPNPKKAKFHKDKKNVSNNLHYVNDIKVEVYFSPMDRNKSKPSISERVTYLIDNYCKHDARFIAFAISPNIPISESLLRRSGRGEIRLFGVIDPAFYARYRKNNDVWARPESTFGNRMILPGKEVRKLHSKTLLIDAEYDSENGHVPVTITGSYNFSLAAENVNDENILIIYDKKITNQYYQDFMGILSRAKGETFHHYPEVDTTIWYDYFRINEAGFVDVELATNFRYPINLLGIDAPRRWGGHKDTTYYYSEEAKAFLKDLLKDKSLRIVGVDGELPFHKYGKYNAYVLAKDRNGNIIHVNREMISQGYAKHSGYYKQNKDSVAVFQELESTAYDARVGMWKEPHMVGQKVQTSDAAFLENLFPLNINTATQKELEFLPTVGPGRAQIILEYRERKGGFKKLEDLERIKGIGPATLEKLKPLIIFEDPIEGD